MMKIKTLWLLILAVTMACGPAFAEDSEQKLVKEADAAKRVAAAADKAESLLDPTAQKTDGNYKIQPGDQLLIKIYPEDPYMHGGDVEVTPEGNITLPMIGKVNVSGKSINMLSDELQAVIDRDYLVNPEVVIQIKGFKEASFVILGQVRKPGTYDFPAGDKKFTFLQAVSMAGGFSEVANIKKVKIVRQDEVTKQRKILRLNAERIISGDEQDPQLESGDVINVAESLF